MSFQPADFAGFGGLNLGADAQDSPGAVDLSNVTLSQPGPSRLLPRPGYTLAGTLDLSAVTGWSPVTLSGATSYVMGGATTLQLVAAAGTQTASGTFTTGDPWTVVPYGAANAVPSITNPSFATNTTNWTAATSTITRDTGVYDSSPASGRWDNTGASDNLGLNDQLVFGGTGDLVAGVTYTVTVRIKASATPSNPLRLYLNTDSAQLTSFTPTTSWASYSLSVTPTTTGVAGTFGFTLMATGGAPGCFFYIDGVSMESVGAAYATNAAALVRFNANTTALETFTVGTKAADETSYTYGRTAPVPNTIAVQPKDNRLVACGFTSTTGGPRGVASAAVCRDGVFFSQSGDPDRWDETDYLLLAPGDGETIRAAAAYNDYLLVFKQSKFFVFYGNSVDSTGGTVFNYRTVGNAFGGSSSAIYQGQVCSAPSGVYVITDTGVWKTTGGAPQLVSGALSPLFAQNVSTLAYQGTGYTKLAPRSATGSGGAFWHQGKVYFSVTITRSTATTSSGWLVLDEQSGQWVVWELADTPRVGASVSGAVAFPSGISTSGRKGLLSMDGTATTDNGTAIASYYTSPYLTYGEPKAEKHVRASELHGTGTVTLAWGKDLQTHGTAETVAMSSGIGHARTGARGRSLSFKIAASAAGWTVNRVVPLLQSVRTGR